MRKAQKYIIDCRAAGIKEQKREGAMIELYK